MSNMDSLGRPSSASGQTNSQISPANKGDDDSAGQSLFDGLFSLVNQANPAALEAAQGLPAKAIFMSLSPVDQDNNPDADALPGVDAGQMSFLDSDKEGSDKLTRLLLAAAEIVPDAGLPTVSDVATSDMTASDMTASDMTASDMMASDMMASDMMASDTMASGISPVAISSESVLVVRNAAALATGAAAAKLIPQANNSGNVVPVVELPGSSVDADTTSQFVGPMPLTDSDRSLFGGTVGAHQFLARPHVGFVGPMPQPLHHHQPASMPSPLAISGENGWQIMEPPSRLFIGPMPAVPKPDFLAGNGGMSSEADMLRDKGTIVSKPEDQSVQMMSKSAANTVKTPANPANPIQAAMTGSKAAADVALQSVQAAAISGEQTRTSRAYSDAVQASSAGNTSAADSPAAASNGGGQSSSGGGHGGGAQHQSAQAADGFGARDASARMVVHRLNTERHGWAGTMVRQLDASLKNGTQSIRIILQPGKLGRLNVDLGLRKGAAHIRVGAESAEAAQLLKGARHHLSQMLEQSGMRLAGLQTVNIGGEGGLGQGGHGQQEAAGENGGRKQAFSNKMQRPDGVAATQTGEADTQDLLPRAGENAVLSILA